MVQQLQKGHADDVVYRSARRVAHERAVALSTTVSDMSIEPKKYELRLPDALSLLQLNYALISSISALGAIRNHMGEHKEWIDSPFMQTVAQYASRLEMLMRSVPDDEMMARLHHLRQELHELAPSEDEVDVAKHVLWSQLQRIADRLVPYFETLRHDTKVLNMQLPG